MSFDPSQHPHRRLNPLTGDAIIVAPQRLQRPWRGQIEAAPADILPAYDPTCYLCPGNTRAGGQRNPAYETTYVFSNDYPSLLPQTDPPLTAPQQAQPAAQRLLQVESVAGDCRVICFSPRHDLTLPQMDVSQIRSVVNTLAQQTAELGRSYPWVQFFENKGAMMGCSNAHPHGQIWGMDTLPTEARKEEVQQRRYYDAHGVPLLVDYSAVELGQRERIVVENEQWLAVVPFWATWPFELILLPRRHVLRLPDLEDSERIALAQILRRLLTRYDNLFQTSFPYAMGWHGAPFWPRESVVHWQLHAHFYPPLLRSATVKKFMVGFELLGEAARDLTPELAAARLRSQSDQHYAA